MLVNHDKYNIPKYKINGGSGELVDKKLELSLRTILSEINEKLNSVSQLNVELKNGISVYQGIATKGDTINTLKIVIYSEDGILIEDEDDVITIIASIDNPLSGDIVDEMINEVSLIDEVVETLQAPQVKLGIIQAENLDLAPSDKVNEETLEHSISTKEQHESLLSGFLETTKKIGRRKEELLSDHIHNLQLNINVNHQLLGSTILRAANQNKFFDKNIVPVVFDTKNLYFYDDEIAKEAKGVNFVNLGLEESEYGITNIQELLDCYSSTFRMRKTKQRSCGMRHCPDYDNNTEEEWLGSTQAIPDKTYYSKKYYQSSSPYNEKEGLMLSYKHYLSLLNKGGYLRVNDVNHFNINIAPDGQYINKETTSQTTELFNKTYQPILGFSSQDQEYGDDRSESGADDVLQSDNTDIWNDMKSKYPYYRLEDGLNKDCFVLRYCSDEFPTSYLSNCKTTDEGTECNIYNNTKFTSRYASGPINILSDNVDSDIIYGNTCDGSQNRTESLYKSKGVSADGSKIELWVPDGKNYENKIRRPPNNVQLVDGENLCVLGYAWYAKNQPYYLWNQYLRQPVDIIGYSNSVTTEPVVNNSIILSDIIENSDKDYLNNNDWVVHRPDQSGGIPFYNNKNGLYLFNLNHEQNGRLPKQANEQFLSNVIPTLDEIITLHQDEIHDCKNLNDVNKILARYGSGLEDLRTRNTSLETVKFLRNIFKKNSEIEISVGSISNDYVRDINIKNNINNQLDRELLQIWKDKAPDNQNFSKYVTVENQLRINEEEIFSMKQSDPGVKIPVDLSQQQFNLEAVMTDVVSYIKTVAGIFQQVLDDDRYDLETLYQYLDHLKLGKLENGTFNVNKSTQSSYRSYLVMDNYKNLRFDKKLSGQSISFLLSLNKPKLVDSREEFIKIYIAIYYINRYHSNRFDSLVANMSLGYNINRNNLQDELSRININYDISIPFTPDSKYYNHKQLYSRYDYYLTNFTKTIMNSEDRGHLFNDLVRNIDLQNRKLQLEKAKANYFPYEVSQESLKVLQDEYLAAKDRFLANKEQWLFFNKQCQNVKITKIYYSIDEIISDNQRQIIVDSQFDTILDDYKELRKIIGDFGSQGCLISGKGYSPLCFMKCTKAVFTKYNLTEDLTASSSQLIKQILKDKITDHNPFERETAILKRIDEVTDAYINYPNLSDKQLGNKTSSLQSIRTHVREGDYAVLIQAGKNNLYQRLKNIWIEQSTNVNIDDKSLCDISTNNILSLNLSDLLKGNCAYGEQVCVDRRMLRWSENMRQKEREYQNLKNVLGEQILLEKLQDKLQETIKRQQLELVANKRLASMVKINTAQNRLFNKIMKSTRVDVHHRESNVPESFVKAFRQLNLISDFDEKYSAIKRFINKYGLVYSDQNSIYWNLKGVVDEKLCCKHYVLLCECAYKSNNVRSQLLDKLVAKWGAPVDGNRVCCKKCGENLDYAKLAGNVEFSEEGSVIQGPASSVSIREQRETMVEHVLSRQELTLYHELITSKIDNYFTIMPELKSADAKATMEAVSEDTIQIMSFSNYINKVFDNKIFNINEEKFPFIYSQDRVKRLTALLETNFMGGSGGWIRPLWNRDFTKDTKQNEGILATIRNKLLEYCQDNNISLDECGAMFMDISNLDDTQFIRQLNERIIKADSKTIASQLKTLKKLDKGEKPKKEERNNWKDYLGKLTFSLNFMIIIENFKTYYRYYETIAAISNLCVQLFIATPSYQLNAKNTKSGSLRFTWGTFSEHVRKLIKDPSLLSNTRIPDLIEYLFSEELQGFIVYLGTLISSEPVFSNHKFPINSEIREISEKLGGGNSSRQVITSTLFSKIISKLSRTENFTSIIRRINWDKQQKLVAACSNNWNSFKPPLGNNSLTSDDGKNYLTLQDLDREINTNLANLSSQLVVRYINVIINNTDDLIIIPKKNNQVQSCCPYRVKSSYLKNLIMNYPNFQKLINRLAIQSDNYNIPCVTKTIYYENIDLQPIGNLDYYYYLDQLVDTASQQVDNRRLYQLAMTSIKNKIKEIYLTFSFDSKSFGKKRIYKALKIPNFTIKYRDFWNGLATDYENQIMKIKTECEKIIRNRVIDTSRLPGLQPIDQASILNILTNQLLKTGGQLERDLLTDKFKIELINEIDSLLEGKELLELYHQLLWMRSLAYKNNTIKLTGKKLAINQPDLITPVNSINRQITNLLECLDKITDGLISIYPDEAIYGKIIEPFTEIKTGFSVLRDNIFNTARILDSQHQLVNTSNIYQKFIEIYRHSIDDEIDQIWKKAKVRNILDSMKNFTHSLFSGKQIGKYDVANLFDTQNTKGNILINKDKRKQELLDKTVIALKSENIYDETAIDVAKIEVAQQENIGSHLEMVENPEVDARKTRHIVKIMTRILRDKYDTQILQSLKNAIHLCYHNITSETQKWNINQHKFIVDSLPIYNKTYRCLDILEKPSILEINFANTLVEFLFILNIYLYLNENRLESISSHFYYPSEPSLSDIKVLSSKCDNLLDGLIPSIIVNNRMSDITEKEMTEHAVQRNLEKQERNKVRTSQMDEEARKTHQIFRLHNLGEHFGSFGEEQQYSSGDNVDRSVLPEGDYSGTGDLDEAEANLLTNEGFDEAEE